MMRPKSVKLSASPVQLNPDGTVRVRTGQGHPVDAWQAGEVQMTESSRHGGEHHVDGDEVLYLISSLACVSPERGSKGSNRRGGQRSGDAVGDLVFEACDDTEAIEGES
jgi:hypothetical protein